ncbi:MAG: IPT/TIG domain-containing protein, partial [Pseudomonadota bacterium]|nr:IPT/TIG domain-containing protein [Pseudomonadota bacterium]
MLAITATRPTQAADAPTISSFTPSSGPVGTVITVTGTNLSGSTAAWVGSAHDAGVTNISSTSMQMTVPADAPVAADQLAIVTPG